MEMLGRIKLLKNIIVTCTILLVVACSNDQQKTIDVENLKANQKYYLNKEIKVKGYLHAFPSILLYSNLNDATAQNIERGIHVADETVDGKLTYSNCFDDEVVIVGKLTLEDAYGVYYLREVTVIDKKSEEICFEDDSVVDLSEK